MSSDTGLQQYRRDAGTAVLRAGERRGTQRGGRQIGGSDVKRSDERTEFSGQSPRDSSSHRAGQRLAWKRHGGRALLRDAGVAYPQGSWVSRDRYHRDTSGRRGERAARRSSCFGPARIPSASGSILENGQGRLMVVVVRHHAQEQQVSLHHGTASGIRVLLVPGSALEQAMTLMAESSGDPAALVAPLREAVRRVDASQPIYTMSQPWKSSIDFVF